MLIGLDTDDRIDDEEYGQLFPEEAEFRAWVECMERRYEEENLFKINRLAARAAALDRAEEMVDR